MQKLQVYNKHMMVKTDGETQDKDKTTYRGIVGLYHITISTIFKNCDIKCKDKSTI